MLTQTSEMGDCVQCHEPLMLKVEETPDEPGVPTASYANGHSHYVPDDVELACGCHFHWCLSTSLLSAK